METRRYRVELLVDVTALDESDSREILNDYFGVGFEGEDVDVVSVEITDVSNGD